MTPLTKVVALVSALALGMAGAVIWLLSDVSSAGRMAGFLVPLGSDQVWSTPKVEKLGSDLSRILVYRLPDDARYRRCEAIGYRRVTGDELVSRHPFTVRFVDARRGACLKSDGPGTSAAMLQDDLLIVLSQ